MPATRRAHISGGPATKGAQSTLSFGGGRSKVTKQSSNLSKDVKDKSITLPAKIEELLKPSDVKTVDDDVIGGKAEQGHISSEAVIAKQAAAELAKPKTKEEELAEKVSDAQIKKYWRAREAERIAPRVHQQDLSTEEKILRLFDMSSNYGPCIGIARMKRWVRANKLGLNPPIEVLAVLLKEEKKGNHGIERAYVDELMSSKFVVGEA